MTISVSELHWAAGFLEGEGSFLSARRSNGRIPLEVTATQVQREPLDRLQGFFGGNMAFHRERRPRHNPTWRWSISGARAAAIMMTIFSILSPKRKEQIRKALSAWMKRPAQPKYRTHCPAGHAYSLFGSRHPPNKHHPGGARDCKLCGAARQRVKYALRSKSL